MANMKLLIIFAFVAVLLHGVVCDIDIDHGYCPTDDYCDADECCVKSYIPGRRSKVCKDMGDDIGDRCGGEYQCSTCTKGLVCVPDGESIWNKFLKGTGSCRPSSKPANAGYN